MSQSLFAVTVTYNGGSVLQSFLDCMLAQTGIDWHLIIIDNASTDATALILREIHDSRMTVIFNAENTGFAAASNQGIGIARGKSADHVLLINNDTEFGPTLFHDLAASLQSTGGDAITPLIPFFDRPDRIWYGGGQFLTLRGGISFHDRYEKPVSAMPENAFKTDYAPGCCLVLKTSVFDQIGYLDEQFFVYWEDSDFCWRMREEGLTIMCDPRITLLHKVSVSTGGGESDFSIRYLYRNYMLFLRKHHGAAFRAYVLAVIALKALVRLSLGRTDKRRLGLQVAAMKEGLDLPVFPGRGVQPAWSIQADTKVCD